MTELQTLQQKINETTQAMVRMERMIVDRPDLPSLGANLRSMRARLANLEAEFRAAADAVGLDICNYTLFVDDSRPTLPSFIAALGDFQTLFSLVYGALVEGPKQTAHLREELASESTFGLAYTFTGSLGVALTMPNERLLLEEVGTRLDHTIESIFSMAKAETPDDVKAFARRLGSAPVRALYKWASDHVKADVGASIEWRRVDRVRAGLVIQPPELLRLQTAIAVTSEEKIDPLVINRVDLIGADLASRTFHIKVGDKDIRGRFTDAISPERAAVLPSQYKATFRVTTRTRYAYEVDDTDYFLETLGPPDDET